MRAWDLEQLPTHRRPENPLTATYFCSPSALRPPAFIRASATVYSRATRHRRCAGGEAVVHQLNDLRPPRQHQATCRIRLTERAEHGACHASSLRHSRTITMYTTSLLQVLSPLGPAPTWVHLQSMIARKVARRQRKVRPNPATTVAGQARQRASAATRGWRVSGLQLLPHACCASGRGRSHKRVRLPPPYAIEMQVSAIQGMVHRSARPSILPRVCQSVPVSGSVVCTSPTCSVKINLHLPASSSTSSWCRVPYTVRSIYDVPHVRAAAPPSVPDFMRVTVWHKGAQTSRP